MSAMQKALTQIVQGTVIVAIAILLTAPASTAGEVGSPVPTINTITPPTQLDTARTNIRANDYFDVVGRLNLIKSNLVVIGNRKLTVKPGLGLSGVRRYNLVGANLDEKGNVVALKKITDAPN
jgi:hypothetical protein